MKKKFVVNCFLVFLITCIPIPSFAEGEETPPSAPAAEETYVPPAEAYEGVGGWAVVDPATGNVHGVIVCTADVCGPSGSFGGKLAGEYMGCTNCSLRFQTRATSDGNVAGWHGTQTNIDEKGNATQSNDGSVKWNEKDKNFTIANKYSDGKGNSVSNKMTLIPEKTATDGVNLSTGLVKLENTIESKEDNDSVSVTTSKENLEAVENISVKYSNWEKDPLLKYESIQGFVENIDKDVDRALVSQGENIENPENEVVVTIKKLTTKVKEFISKLFGFDRTISEDNSVADVEVSSAN